MERYSIVRKMTLSRAMKVVINPILRGCWAEEGRLRGGI